MTLPALNINGTSKDLLIEQICDATNALREAARKMEAACPNRRDYVFSATHWDTAYAEHLRRVRTVESLMYEYQEMADAIDRL
jgi:hypothetical protein